MKYVWMFLLLFARFAPADFGFTDRVGNRFSLYHQRESKDLGKILLVSCPASAPTLTRSDCKQTPIATQFYETAMANLAAMQGIPAAFAGAQGLMLLNIGEFSLDSQTSIRFQKYKKILLENKLDFWRFLEEGEDFSWDVRSGGTPLRGNDVVKINALFENVWFNENSFQGFRLASEKGNFEKALEVCGGPYATAIGEMAGTVFRSKEIQNRIGIYWALDKTRPVNGGAPKYFLSHYRNTTSLSQPFKQEAAYSILCQFSIDRETLNWIPPSSGKVKPTWDFPHANSTVFVPAIQ